MKPSDLPDVIGQDATIFQIPDPLPPTVFLRGPPGVGKRTLARALAARMASGPDLQVLSEPFTVDKARAMIRHHETKAQGPCRVTVADLTGASESALQMILKLLEEVPNSNRIILHHNPGGGHSSFTGVYWRCFWVTMPLLARKDVETILTRLKVPNPQEAAVAARGSVRAGITYAYSEEARRAIKRVLEAFERRDVAVLEEVLNDVLEGSDSYRDALCDELLNSLRSLPVEVPMDVIVDVADILTATSRPNLRFRAAVWTLAGA